MCHRRPSKRMCQKNYEEISLSDWEEKRSVHPSFVAAGWYALSKLEMKWKPGTERLKRQLRRFLNSGRWCSWDSFMPDYIHSITSLAPVLSKALSFTCGQFWRTQHLQGRNRDLDTEVAPIELRKTATFPAFNKHRKQSTGNEWQQWTEIVHHFCGQSTWPKLDEKDIHYGVVKDSFIPLKRSKKNW